MALIEGVNFRWLAGHDRCAGLLYRDNGWDRCEGIAIALVEPQVNAPSDHRRGRPYCLDCLNRVARNVHRDNLSAWL